MAVDDNAGRVDEDDAADPTRAGERELGGDRSADGVSHDGDVVQIELLEERGVERGETGDAVQRVWTRRAAESRVSRGEDPGVVGGAEQLAEGCDGDGTGTAVQEQEGAPASSFGDGDIYRAGGSRDGVCAVHINKLRHAC